jgi:TM2 domain-containing membrane protein YozV
MSEKSGIVALLLVLFLGYFGAHRFYVGKTGTAILQILTFGGFGIWILIDLIMIIVGKFEDSDGKVLELK